MALQSKVAFEHQLKALRILIEQTSGGVLTFGLYSDLPTREQAAERLREKCSVPIRTIALSPESNDPVGIIRAFPPAPRACFLFLDVEAAFPNLLGYVNFGREALLQSGHALVFWIREEGLRRIAAEAPDFWAWRSNVFDFRTADIPELEIATGPHDPVIGHYRPADLAAQAEALEEDTTGDFVSKLGLGRRQLALRRFEEAGEALQQAENYAEKRGDLRGLAEALLLLGNSKFELKLLEEAEPLYRRSFEIASRIGSKEQMIAALRQLSLLQQTKGDTDSAYQTALTMMQVAADLKDPASLASTYDQLGNVLFNKRDLRGAEQAFLSAAKYEELLRHESDLAFTLARLGRVYEEMGDVTKAEEVLRKAARLFRESELQFEAGQVAQILERIGAR
jgi:tetratricopeptide (TPR) repeat protein